MDLTEVVLSMQFVELTAKTRADAIRALAQAAGLEEEGIPIDTVIEAIENREAAAHTVVASDLALPHATIDWTGDYRIVLGRSRKGVDFGTPGGKAVHLIVLLLNGTGREQLHLRLLSALAELLKSEEFRRSLEEALDIRAIEHLLMARVGLEPDSRQRRRLLRLNVILTRQAVQLVDALAAQALLLAVDRLESVPWELLSHWEGRLLVITTETSPDFNVNRADTHVFDVPHATLSRMDRANLGLLLAALTGLLDERARVVCVTGPDGRRMDSITIAKPEPHLRRLFTSKNRRQAAVIPPAVILRVLAIAIELAAEGREARAVGGLFIVGDTPHVLRFAHQLVLNPFRGYARHLRNVLDPSLAETIKEFAIIDGAFLVRADGTVHSAGTYLMPQSAPTGLPPGLGTRHQTAAAITLDTQAMAIAVSQSTGTVTVFRDGAIAFTLERAGITRW